MLIKSITLTKKYTIYIYIYIYELIQIIYGITFGNIVLLNDFLLDMLLNELANDLHDLFMPLYQ